VDGLATWTDLHFSVVCLLQVAACDLEGADSAQFLRVIDRLAHQVPHPRTAADARALADLLYSFSTRAGARFHRLFHQVDPWCGAPAVLEECESVWSSSGEAPTRPAVVLARWGREFTARFQSGHHWPPEELAARHLRSDFRRPLDVDATAEAVAISRAALMKRFRRTFGVSLGNYQRVLRTREAIRLLRETPACADAVARDVGYQSTKNLYAVLRTMTGCRPDEIRHRSPEAFAAFSQLCRSLRLDPPPCARG